MRVLLALLPMLVTATAGDRWGHLPAGQSLAASEFDGEFAPTMPAFSEFESGFRREISLNGRWNFQPMDVPGGFKEGTGNPPALPDPSPSAWELVPIKIPSPWNVNAWGGGRNVGKDSPHPYWPDSVYFPSYPPTWEEARMGWLRRHFPKPRDLYQKRAILRFEAVAGDCEVCLNGKTVARHFDSWLPFEVDVTDALRDENELLVGVRSHEFFRKQSAVYPKMNSPFPTGSETSRLLGIWQDVSLRIVPEVRISDVFVKTLCGADRLEIDVTISNQSGNQVFASITGEVAPWINRADERRPGVPAGACGEPLLRIPNQIASIPAGGSVTTSIIATTHGALKEWSPGSPVLHGVNLSVLRNQKPIDQSTTRFGWREFRIQGKDLLLNGKKIQLTGDLLHPFGPFVLSRSYVWAWYRMIKDFGGNAARPHAQIHPKHYLDLADEMGIVVLDETSIFGSSVALNFEEDSAWKRFEDHVDGWVLRDRNHPSVLGWSFGNELFAIFQLNNVPVEQSAAWYRKLGELGNRTRQLDPTRAWISCDGDEDLRGALPVWSAHFGHGTPLERLPDLNKPLMVGESGGSYYARPSQLAEFNGDRAYQNYVGRNEALAIDLYDNIVRMARPKLAYFSASETAWFGLEHLNFGYNDFTRLPTLDDGVFLTKPYQEGKPGIQPERIPPHVATLNPGWDRALPLYKPLAMFHAMKAALAEPNPAECEWDHRRIPEKQSPNSQTQPTIHEVAFIGDSNSPLATRLKDLGVPIGPSDAEFRFADGGKCKLDELKSLGGTTFLFPGENGEGLPAGISSTPRNATMLVKDTAHPWTAGFTQKDLYFAEDGADRNILSRGIGGSFPDGSKVLLKAGEADWSLFNETPEFAKCAAVVLYERLQKPGGAALIEMPWGKGRLVICGIDWKVASASTDAMWRGLLENMGIRLAAPADRGVPAFDRDGVLVNALIAAPFHAGDLNVAMARDFVDEARIRPEQGTKSHDIEWKAVASPSRDRFQFPDIARTNAAGGATVAYFSFWIESPRALDDLLLAGPDAPKFRLGCYVSDACRLFINGTALTETRSENADYRKLVTFDGIPLKKGWNHILIKVATDSPDGAEPGTLAVRMGSSQADFLGRLRTAVEWKNR